METFSLQQQKALALVPKFTAAMSLIGSAWIIFEVLRDRRKRGLVYHRLMLGMSIGDVLYSSALFLSTWPMPVETVGVYGAAGTTQTCTAQGFFVQLGSISLLYQAFLATYYLLTLRYSWRESRLKIMERFAHGLVVSLGLSTASAGIPLQLYNSALLWCWFAKYPRGCANSRGKGLEGLNFDQEGSLDTCTRGDNSWVYGLAFCYAWEWLALLIIVGSMTLVYWTVHQQAKKMKRYGGGGGWIEKNKQKVARQGMYYIVTFVLLNGFNTVVRVTFAVTDEAYFPLLLLMAIFAPLQGVLNGVIYLRPRYRLYKKIHPEWSIPHIIKRVLLRAFSSKAADTDDEDHQLGVFTNSDAPEEPQGSENKPHSHVQDIEQPSHL